MQRRSHEGPVLKLSRHGIHGCAVDSRLNSQIRLSWFPIKTGANRESPRFPSGPAFDRRFFFRKSPRIGRGDRRGTRETARSIERFSRELRQPGIALCQGYRSSKAENERVIPTNRFQPPTEAWRFSEKRRGIPSNMQRRACMRGWLHPYGKGPEG